MRIAEINDIASVATEIGAGLQARGHDVGYIHPRLFGATLPPALKPITAPIRAPDWLDMVFRLRRGGYDLAHIHYAYLGNLGWLAGVPYILHCHGSDVRDRTFLTRPLTRQALGHARHVFYATPDLRQFLSETRADAEFLPNPIDLERFSPSTPARDARDVFLCSALTEIKGAATTLEACRQLASRRPDIRITAYAGGEFAPEFDKLPTVTLIAHQPRWKIPEIVNRHAVISGQVKVGAAGMAELEAMACGRPVITWFNHPGAYPEEPPFINAPSAPAMADAIERLIDNPTAREAAGAAGRAWIEKYHALDRIAARVEAVARAIVDGRPVPPPD